MKIKIFAILSFTLVVTCLQAQTNSLRINANIVLPKDSIESIHLISSLNSFLAAAQLPNKENRYVVETEKVETFILLDEINGIEKSGKFKDDFFYKPYLTNIVAQKNGQFLRSCLS